MSKARKDRKAARQANRAQNVAAKRASKERVKIARQENKTARVLARKGTEKQLEETQENEQAAANNTRVEAVRNAAANLPADFGPESLPLKAKVKAINYLKNRKRQVEDENDPEMIGAQFIEERARQIAERHDQIEAEIDENPAYTDDEKDEMIPEYEDVENEILEEEFNTFSFDGNEDNFVDPDTIAMLAKVGKAGVDKYKQKRFAAGKKAFGQTKAQFDAIQAKKAAAAALGVEMEPEGALGAALLAAKNKVVDVKTDETIKEYTPYIIGGSILLVIVGVAIYYSGKSA